ncbi:MAG: hypothetical protein JNN04_15750 [Cyclobacteriaceae bacterium]|nr:hypothetical protein [Cyclobacteriaceae bacterium]
MNSATIARLGICLILLISFSFVSGQEIVQKSLKVDGKSVSYQVLQPAGDISGILLLLPGKGENPKAVFKKTSLPEKLSGKGYMTIVPNLKYALFADELIRKQLEEILKAETEGRPTAGVAIGGFSAGGAVALSYAEYRIAQGSTNIRSVFVIDPPLDLQRLYATSRKTRRFNCPSVASEGQQTIDYLDKALGGSPDDQYNNYVTSSPYMASEADGGNAKWLKQVPVRLYTEPDIEFVKERHCVEMEPQDLNSSDLERLYKHLKKSGNDHCELVTTKGRGYHTWNIADADELSAWIMKF